MTPPLDYPTEPELRWLMIANGINDAALLGPPAVRAAKVKFFDRQTFDFEAEGERVLIFVEQHDLIAWQPRTGQLAAWRGAAFALGEEAIWNPASWFAGSALRVHRSPLEWLLADRDGIAIVQPKLAYAMLRHCSRLAFDDASHTRQVRAWMQPPRLKVQFLVSKEQHERTAA